MSRSCCAVARKVIYEHAANQVEMEYFKKSKVGKVGCRQQSESGRERDSFNVIAALGQPQFVHCSCGECGASPNECHVWNTRIRRTAFGRPEAKQKCAGNARNYCWRLMKFAEINSCLAPYEHESLV